MLLRTHGLIWKPVKQTIFEKTLEDIQMKHENSEKFINKSLTNSDRIPKQMRSTRFNSSLNKLPILRFGSCFNCACMIVSYSNVFLSRLVSWNVHRAPPRTILTSPLPKGEFGPHGSDFTPPWSYVSIPQTLWAQPHFLRGSQRSDNVEYVVSCH